jgi:hypothetical protein
MGRYPIPTPPQGDAKFSSFSHVSDNQSPLVNKMQNKHFVFVVAFLVALATRVVAVERDLGSITIPVDVRSPSITSLLINVRRFRDMNSVVYHIFRHFH